MPLSYSTQEYPRKSEPNACTSRPRASPSTLAKLNGEIKRTTSFVQQDKPLTTLPYRKLVCGIYISAIFSLYSPFSNYFTRISDRMNALKGEFFYKFYAKSSTRPRIFEQGGLWAPKVKNHKPFLSILLLSFLSKTPRHPTPAVSVLEQIFWYAINRFEKENS